MYIPSLEAIVPVKRHLSALYQEKHRIFARQDISVCEGWLITKPRHQSLMLAR